MQGLAEKVLAGDMPAAARLIRALEDEVPEAAAELRKLYPHTGRAHVVGITGAPGTGKSTLIGRLITVFREQGLRVGVVAIDPSSPFTRGALLGDRLRMQQHATDPEVFIRSLATRGWSGGLARATLSTLHVMDALGKEIILVESVGVGQSELDISRVADTTLVVLIPGMGDDIQIMKAGILEIGDIFVVNKADKEGADNLKRDLEGMLQFQSAPGLKWQPEIILTEATRSKGSADLAAAVVRHREHLKTSGEITVRRQARARLELLDAVNSLFHGYLQDKLTPQTLDQLAESLVRGETDPDAAAEIVLARLFKP
jgi:LAO/AO transport system kinase